MSLEILAPAGSPESLLPAVRLGANAVYLGASRFSARGNAGNFDREQLRQAVAYCRARDVKVYLAVNTLLRDDELPEAMELVEYACSLPVDALIVQDVGFASLVHQAAPHMRLHGSTQMSVYTPMGAAALYDAGFSRVVLSRELSLGEIKEIAASSPIELEVFVHGALCMSVSGQCYFSALLGGRSGNRGLCAQPCRLPFSAPGGTGHDLSLKDCSNIGLLRELSAAGVTSAKIEGRMKRPEYVAAAVAACRCAADGKPVPPQLLRQLEAVFSRSGFTDGYLKDQRGRSMFGIRQKEDVTAATGQVLSQLRAGYKDEARRVPLEGALSIAADQPTLLRLGDRAGHQADLMGERPVPALHVPLTEEKCREQLEKTGGTPFYFDRLTIAVGEGLSLPMKELNRLRREGLAELERLRAQEKPIPYSRVSLPRTDDHQASRPLKLRARFPSAQVPAVFKSCEWIYVPLFSKEEDLLALLERGFSVAAEIPRGMFGREKQVLSQLERVKRLGIAHVWAGDLNAVAAAQESGMRIHGGFGLNLFNTASLEWAEDNGLEDVECSFELTLEQADRLGGTLPRGLLVYGRLPMMLASNRPGANGPRGCAGCARPAVLTDRKGMEFPLQCNGGCTEILNAIPLNLCDRLREIKGFDFAVFRFSVENSVETEENFRLFHQGKRPAGRFTRGLSDRGVD